MLKSKDFKMMDVFYSSGKYVGFINDLLIDFNNKKVVGFKIISSRLLGKDMNVSIDSLISYSNSMIICKTNRKNHLKLSDIKNLDIVDRHGNIVGVFEDILFDEKDYKIKAVVISLGYLTNFTRGKKIISISDLMIGEKNVLFIGNDEKVYFISKPHNLIRGDEFYEHMNFKKICKFIIVAVCILLFFIVRKNNNSFREITNLIFISFFISYSLKPIYKFMIAKGYKKKFSSIMLILCVLIIFIASLSLVIPAILKESLNIGSTLNNLEKTIDAFYKRVKLLGKNKTFYLVFDDVNNKVTSYLSLMFTKAFSKIMNIGGNFLSILVIPIISYYFLVDSRYFEKKMLVLFPVSVRGIIEKVTDDIDKVMSRYILSQILLSLIISVTTFVILIFLKVDYPVILSLLNGFFNIIPYFGPVFGAIPSILLALTISPSTAIYTAIWLYLLQTFEGNIISPKITGDSVNMHPFIVIILLIIGGKIGGILGMVIAVPLVVATIIIYDDLNYYIF